MAYNDLEAIKRYLGVKQDQEDPLLEELILGAKAMIDEDLDFSFDVDADTTRTFDPTKDVKGYELHFDTWLAADPTTITNKADASSTEVIASGNYILLPPNEPPYFGIKLLSSKGYAWSYENDPEVGITIKGPWGWSAVAPADILQAHRRLTAFLYRQKDASADLDRPLLTADGVTILPSDMPADVAKILNKYRWLS